MPGTGAPVGANDGKIIPGLPGESPSGTTILTFVLAAPDGSRPLLPALLVEGTKKDLNVELERVLAERGFSVFRI